MVERVPRSLVVALLVTLVLAGAVSGFASGSPDGLESVADRLGFASAAADSPLATSPVADYAVAGVEHPRVSGGLAGVAGVLVTLAGMLGLSLVLRRRGPRER